MNLHSEVGSIPWREWSEEAFLACRQERKPILLTLTATWCHWCHVMDETSYSDPRIIDLVRSRFVPVKVDVDQRQDISKRYNQGGFPSVAILNGHGDVLFGGIYTPPDEMLRLLEQAAAGYSESSEPVSEPRADTGAPSLARQPAGDSQATPTGRVLDRLRQLYDPQFGGFGEEPKQPPWEALRLLIALYSRSGDKSVLNMLLKSLDGMQTGLYDSKDQGFFRYSVARDWKVPHYEKMVVTNANLAILYLEGYQLTQRKAYKDIAAGALDYLLGALYDQTRGLFCSSQDAWEDYYRLPWKDREAATKPTVDQAAYAGWNALSASAFIKAYGVLGTPSRLHVAAAVLDLLWDSCWDPQRGMVHVIGGPQKQPNVLEDHVFFVRASLDLYQATGRAQHLQRAIDVAGYVLSAFRAPDGGFYDIYEGGDSGPQNLPGQILLREKPVMENALLGEALATLSCLTGDEQYLRETEQSLKVFGAVVPGGTYIGPKKSRRMEEDEERLFLPAGSAWARAWHMMSWGPVHLVIVGASVHPGTEKLLRAALKVCAPHRVVQVYDPDRDGERITALGFPVRNEPALYACMDRMCLAPITSASQVSRLTNDRPWATG